MSRRSHILGRDRRAVSQSDRLLYYYITDRRQLSRRAFYERVRRLASWGVDFIQVREKDLPDRELFRLARIILALVDGTPCRVIINSRADIALASGAHGVHLPSKGLCVQEVRGWLPAGFLVGVSTHSREEARKAQDAGADYALLGPVFETPSKEGYGPPLGLARFRDICGQVRLPVFGIGGIRSGDIPGIMGAGAAGIAAIRLFQAGSELNLRKSRTFRSSGARDPENRA